MKAKKERSVSKMSGSGETADQAMRMTLQGIQMTAELALRLGGGATRSLAVFLYKVLSEQRKVKGKATLTSLLKSGEELKIFAIQRKDLQAFYKEAKKYGILYHVVMKEKGDNGVCDIMVRTKDADKIARIADRLEIATLDSKAVNRMMEAKEQNKEVVNKDKGVMSEQEHNELLKNIMEVYGKNPKEARMEKKENLSEPFSKTEKPISDKPSVRQELENIKKEQRNRRKPAQRKTKNKAKNRRKNKNGFRENYQR